MTIRPNGAFKCRLSKCTDWCLSVWHYKQYQRTWNMKIDLTGPKVVFFVIIMWTEPVRPSSWPIKKKQHTHEETHLSVSHVSASGFSLHQQAVTCGRETGSAPPQIKQTEPLVSDQPVWPSVSSLKSIFTNARCLFIEERDRSPLNGGFLQRCVVTHTQAH